MAPFMPGGATKLAGILNITIPEGGPSGGEDVWTIGKAPIAAGLPLNNPEVLFPKLDKDVIAALAELHLNGEAF